MLYQRKIRAGNRNESWLVLAQAQVLVRETAANLAALARLKKLARETRGKGEAQLALPVEGALSRAPLIGEMTERPKVLAC